MSILPASRLSQSDLSLLGNNVRPSPRRRLHADLHRRRGRRELSAVNRSLASVGERLAVLHWPALLAAR